MQSRITVLTILLIALTAIILPAGAAAAATSNARPVIACKQSSVGATQARASNQADVAQQAQAQMLALLPPSGATVTRQYTYLPCLALEAPSSVISALQAASADVRITDDELTFTTLAESTAVIGAPAAWAKGYTGAGQTIAVLDTGIDATHPFLAGKVVAQACFSNANGHGTGSSLCPGGAGSSTMAGAGLNCHIEGCSHGTHVAGIAAGHSTSSTDFSGVARDATLIAAQVFTRFDSGCAVASPCVAAYTSDQLAALEYVYGQRANFAIAAVNMSLGGKLYTSACDGDARKSAIDLLRSVNIATVVSAGNQGSSDGLTTPACISSAISVGSTGDGGPGSLSPDQVSQFSNSATFLNLLAPGEAITSSVPGGYQALDGTSMAAPHVAGAWAILKARQPSATVDAVLAALTRTGAPVTDPRNAVTTPRIQVDAAAEALMGAPLETIDDLTFAEGNAGTHDATFTVHLSAASASPVMMHYATANITARAGSDYTTTRGTLTIPAGERSGTIVVPVDGDTIDENDEQFSLTLSDASNVALTRTVAQATLTNDDAPPTVVIDDTIVSGGRATFAVHLSAPSGRTITVDYTSTGTADDAQGGVAFAPGTTSQSIAFSVPSSAPASSASPVTVRLLDAVNATIARAEAVGFTDPVAQPTFTTIFVPVVQR